MNKFIQTLTNTRGDVLPGDRLQVVTSAGAIVDIYADDSSTPFTDSDGNVVNYATADLNGLVEFYWTPASGQVLQQLDTTGTLRRAITDFAKPYLLSEFGGEVAQAQVTGLVDDLAAKAATADLASTDTGKGDALVAHSAGGTGAISDTVQNVLRMGAINVMSYIPIAERAAITAGTSTTNVTAYIQAALDAHLHIQFPGGLFRLETSALTLRSGHRVSLSPDTTIRQYTEGAGAFTATSLSNAWIFLNGGAIRGPGGWSSGWTGMSGREGYRGVRFIGCTISGIVGPGRVFNWGNAAVDFTGACVGCLIQNVRMEGTNGYSQAISANDNNQACLYLTNSAGVGSPGVAVIDCDISNTAQGILRENQAAGIDPTEPCMIVGGHVHDIQGQHGFYNQDGMLTVVGTRFTDCNTSAMKSQSADANRDLYGITCTGIEAYGCTGGALFEVACIGTGSIQKIRLEGHGYNCGYLATTNGEITGSISASGSSLVNSALNSIGDSTRMTIELDADSMGQDGIVVTATNSEFDLYPAIRNINSGNTIADAAALRVVSASATVRAYSPRFVNSDALKEHDILVNGASTVTVIGERLFSGSTGAVLNNTGGTIYDSAWVDYTPTYTSGAGSLTAMTTNHARYKVDGKTVHLSLDVTITDAGTGTGVLKATLPIVAGYATSLNGFEQVSTGNTVRPAIRPADLTLMEVSMYDNSAAIATGRRFIIAGTYQRA